MATCANAPTERSTSHSCTHCGKIFPFLSHLKRHITGCSIATAKNAFRSITPAKINSEFDYGNQMILDNQSESQELESRNLETPNNQVIYIDDIKQELGSDEPSVANTKEMVKNENPFYCPHCTKTFPHFSRLKRHMVVCRIATGKNGPFLCPHCEKAFPHFSRLKRHMAVCRIATGKNEPHFCPNCGKSFPLQSRLKRHLPVCPVTKQKPIHSCSHCGKIFPFASRLKRHLEKIHNEFELNPGIVGSELDYDNQYPVILEDQSGNPEEWDPSGNLEIPNGHLENIHNEFEF